MYNFNMKKHNYHGKLLVFTGVDGSGKTTLINETKCILEKENIKYRTVKMPSNRIRKMDEFRNFHDSHDINLRNQISPFALTVLVSGDRLITQETEVIPALKRGEWVLCDRYMFTGLTICNDPIIIDITNRFLAPDKVFLMSASPETIKKRIDSRIEEKDRYYDNKAVIKRINIYDQIAKDNEFFVKINTEKDYAQVIKKLRLQINSLI